MSQKQYDAIVVGGGPAGLSAASLLAEQGVETALISPVFPQKPKPNARDPRTIAMMQPSVRLLEHMGLWPERLKDVSSPLKRLRLLDDAATFLSGTELTFDCDELNREPFGWNVPLPDLSLAFYEKASKSGVDFIKDACSGGLPDKKQITVETETQGPISAKIVLAADGRQSVLRKSAGIGVAAWAYDQVAIGAVFAHSGPHNDMSTECHKQDGPLTTVPMPDNHSSLVWMMRPPRAEKLMAMSDKDFARELQLELDGVLGAITEVTNRKAFPMEGLNALTYGQNRVMLVGEAAHVVPPIGAQGLNMSLRDGAMAAELIGDALGFGKDIGADSVLEQYDVVRRRDVWPRQKVIDLMDRSLLARLPGFHDLRALGIKLASQVTPLRTKIMQEGISPVDNLPRVMQG